MYRIFIIWQAKHDDTTNGGHYWEKHQVLYYEHWVKLQYLPEGHWIESDRKYSKDGQSWQQTIFSYFFAF